MIKLDLRSPLYHNKNKKKKRILSQNDNTLKNLQLQLSKQSNIFNPQFQLCCPNCQCLFHPNQQNNVQNQKCNQNHHLNNNVNQNHDIIKNSTNNKQPSGNQQKYLHKNISVKQVQIQTQQIYNKYHHFQQISKQSYLSSKSHPQFIKTDILYDKLDKKNKIPILKKNKTDILPSFPKQSIQNNQQQQQIQHEKSPNKKRKITKQNLQKISKTLQIVQQFPVKTAYLQPNKNPQQKNNYQNIQLANQHIHNLKNPNKSSHPHPQIFQQDDLILSQIRTKLSNHQYLHEQHQKIYLREQIAQIINYQMNLPQKSNIPSYCKMLAYQIQDSRQGNIKKQITHYDQYYNGDQTGKECFRGHDYANA